MLDIDCMDRWRQLANEHGLAKHRFMACAVFSLQLCACVSCVHVVDSLHGKAAQTRGNVVWCFACSVGNMMRNTVRASAQAAAVHNAQRALAAGPPKVTSAGCDDREWELVVQETCKGAGHVDNAVRQVQHLCAAFSSAVRVLAPAGWEKVRLAHGRVRYCLPCTGSAVARTLGNMAVGSRTSLHVHMFDCLSHGMWMCARVHGMWMCARVVVRLATIIERR